MYLSRANTLRVVIGHRIKTNYFENSEIIINNIQGLIFLSREDITSESC